MARDTYFFVNTVSRMLCMYTDKILIRAEAIARKQLTKESSRTSQYVQGDYFKFSFSFPLELATLGSKNELSIILTHPFHAPQTQSRSLGRRRPQTPSLSHRPPTPPNWFHDISPSRNPRDISSHHPIPTPKKVPPQPSFRWFTYAKECNVM